MQENIDNIKIQKLQRKYSLKRSILVYVLPDFSSRHTDEHIWDSILYILFPLNNIV